MTRKEIMNLYAFYMQEAVEDYICIGKLSDTYKHFRSVVYGLGFALGYRHSRITADIDNAIADAEKRILSEAI